MRHVFRITAGFVLVIVGLICMPLPIVPGWPLFIPGLILLSDYFPPIKRLLNWARAKLEGTYPELFRKQKAAAEEQ